LSNNSSSLNLLSQFEIHLNSKDWRKESFDQLAKDFQLSGVDFGTVSIEYTLEEILQCVIEGIQRVKSNKQHWDNLNYRIDLPTNIRIDDLDLHELARLFLLRSFQKVWLRKHYSKSISKDEGDDIEKHLKP